MIFTTSTSQDLDPGQRLIERQWTLLQLSDSFFPSGSFSFSHGLESLIYAEKKCSVADFEVFLRLILRRIYSSELVALLHAYRASAVGNLEEVHRAEKYLFQLSLVESTREAQKKNGRALLMVAHLTWPDPRLETLIAEVTAKQSYGLHPTIFGVVGNVAGLEEQETCLIYLHSLVTGLASAAIRLGILGHTHAQLIIKAVASDIASGMEQASGLDLDNMWSFGPEIEIAQMNQKYLPQRQFSS